MVNKFYRNCPDCGIELSYGRKSRRNLANKKNTKCISCCQKGKIHTQEWKDMMRERNLGKNNPNFGNHQVAWNKGLTKETDEGVRRISDAMMGENNPMYDKKPWNYRLTGSDLVKQTDESIKKIRMTTIKNIKKSSRTGMQPNYNPTACKIIDEYGKQNGYNFQHAENDGEYQIKELGYWVDGYDKEKNVVIEYYENYHKKQLQKDKRRKQEIINLLNCKFIELKEWKIYREW
jgi:hypothetical protein